MYSEISGFIRSLYKTMEPIPLHIPYFGGREKDYLLECIDTNFVSSVGKFVDKFENMMAEYTGAKKAVACVNGTSALHLSIILAGVERGDEVLTQALTFVATCNAISYSGAHPVFIDVDLDTMGLSPLHMEEWLAKNAVIKNKECFNKNSGRKIKACVPMHTFGHPVRLGQITELCKKYFIELIEDATESLGSYYDGKHTGTFGKIGVISYNGNKIVTTGGGGVLLFDDIKLGELAKHLTTQAKVPHPWKYVHDNIGYNYRMPNINAALGCAQMETLPQFLENKRQTADLYRTFFSKFEDIKFFNEPENSSSNYWLNSIWLKDKDTQNSFLKFTNDQGIMTRPIWTTMNELPMYNHCQRDNLLNTKWLSDRVVNLPSSFREP